MRWNLKIIIFLSKVRFFTISSSLNRCIVMFLVVQDIIFNVANAVFRLQTKQLGTYKYVKSFFTLTFLQLIDLTLTWDGIIVWTLTSAMNPTKLISLFYRCVLTFHGHQVHTAAIYLERPSRTTSSTSTIMQVCCYIRIQIFPSSIYSQKRSNSKEKTVNEAWRDR